MEETKEAVEGKQPNSSQNELKKETTDPFMNKKPVVRKAPVRASEASGMKSSAKPAAPARSRSSASTSPNQRNHSVETKTPEKGTQLGSKAMAEGKLITDLKANPASKPPKIEKQSDAKKGLESLKKDTKKAEKKVVKIKRKVKKAIRKDVKKGKLQILKDKLLKAFSKLISSNKKLKKANK